MLLKTFDKGKIPARNNSAFCVAKRRRRRKKKHTSRYKESIENIRRDMKTEAASNESTRAENLDHSPIVEGASKLAD